MYNMEADSSPSALNHPRDRVLRRLVQLGVPEEHLDRLYPGIVAFVMENQSWIPELVAAILPYDEEVAQVLQQAKMEPKRAVGPTMKAYFRECMVWIQWLMFLGEPAVALTTLSKMSDGRGVCGAVWGINDIAYRCRTCEHDPTCAICVPCFQNGNHKDHDYSIIYTGGGCCDCGDVTAWKQEGFCSKHKGTEQIQPLQEEFVNSVEPVLDALLSCWKNKLVSTATIRKENFGASEHVAARKKVANELTFVVVEMLLEFCKYSESLLSFVSRRMISLAGLLEILVRAEMFLADIVVMKLHELLLKLLGEPIFKYEFAKVFLGYYPFAVHEAIEESADGALKKHPLLSTFSVQIFTVPTLTPRLVNEMNLLVILLGCLGEIFIHCAGKDGCLQFTKLGNLYETTIRVMEDIRFVMSHGVVPNYVTHEQREILRTWMKLLSFLQGMSPLKRETDLHIEEESEHVNLPFVFGHSIANIHSFLVDGAFSTSEEADDDIFTGIYKQDVDERDNVRHAKVGRLSRESSACSVIGSLPSVSESKVAAVKLGSIHHLLVPSSVTWLIYECLRAIENWLGADSTSGSLFSVNTGGTSDGNFLSVNTGGTSDGNFLASKKALSNIRKSNYIFGGLTRSSQDHNRQSTSAAHGSFSVSGGMEKAKSTGKDSNTIVSRENDSTGSDDSSMEVDGTTELDALRVLSLSDWPDITNDVTSQDVSVHIPLHRLLSLLLQKALRRCYCESSLLNMTSASTSTPSSAVSDDFFRCVLGGCNHYGFSAFVMEHPLRNRVFCAEVHAGMWSKNGDVAIFSCEWYRSVHWSEQGLELDLFLLQCCAALAPADLYVKRIVERFGLLDYLSLNPEQSNEYEPVMVQEMLMLIIQIVQERRFSGLNPTEILKRELIHKLAIGDATRSQLVKALPRNVSKIDQLQEVLDTVAEYSNPSGFNQGIYSMRWPYWKELDLYHPRWNSRDLQAAEERFMRYCSVSAWTTQLPRWTKIYPPLKGIARIATCKPALEIIRAVLFYAVFTDKFAGKRASDGLLLTALHLLSLALDICSQQRELGEVTFYARDYTPMLAFAGEEICEGLNYGAGEQSLLSLLVTLMRMHKRDNLDNFVEVGSCDLASLIESLLKRFAELDSGCMVKLRQLEPEVVIHLSQSIPSSNTNMQGSSDSEKRKAKARERQTAILAKMKAEQSKFLSSITSTVEDDSKAALEESNSDDRQDLDESSQDVCALCHESDSKNPVSFLVLLQKSRLLSFIDRVPSLWDKVQLSDTEQLSAIINNRADESAPNSSSGSGVILSTRLSQLAQNVVNEFADYAQPGEVSAIIDFVKAQFPPLRKTQLSRASKDENDGLSYTLEMLEQDMYFDIRKQIHDDMVVSNSGVENEKFAAAEVACGRNAESVLLGKYMAALSREMTEHPSASESACDDKLVESTSQLSTYDGFGPPDCDGVHVSSCGHAVHQSCLDRYLSSLKKRYSRKIVFEGGHIVDLDQGEFLCPVCRRLANSVLPSLPGEFQNVWKQPMNSIVSSSHTVSIEESNSLRLQQAISLLKSAANMVGKGEILKTIPLKGNERMRPNLDSISRALSRLYLTNRQDNFSGLARVDLSMIMWDTFNYSLVSNEIAARCGRTRTIPTYSLNALYKELKSSSGSILSLLLTIVQSLRSKNSLHVLQRFRGIQLFAESICSGVSLDQASNTNEHGGDMSYILKHVGKEVSYLDARFWNRAAEPVLAHDAFSSLMWVLFCLPGPFLSCEVSLLSLVHVFYVATVAQAIISYCGKHNYRTRESSLHDYLIADISKVVGESGWIQRYFVSNYADRSSDIMDTIRRLTFPFLRRCALLWKLMSTNVSAAFYERDNVMNSSSHSFNDIMDTVDGDLVELNEAQELEKMFKIPQLDVVLKDQVTGSLVMKWLHHFCKDYEVRSSQNILHLTPVVPFKLMELPHLYQDLLQRYIKRHCANCGKVVDEPALCLLCGRLCSPGWKSCCWESECQTHAMACGAGTGVFLLIKRTTILLQRCARKAFWPSPYLDTFGEEDIEMQRGKPLYLNEERYATLTHMVASHGLDRSTKVLGQTTIGRFFLF